MSTVNTADMGFDSLPEWVTQEVKDNIVAGGYNNPDKYFFSTGVISSTTKLVWVWSLASMNKIKQWEVEVPPDQAAVGTPEGTVSGTPLFLDATTADIEDVQNKQWLSVNLPYDYEEQENKIQQEKIHEFVMLNVSDAYSSEGSWEKFMYSTMPSKHHKILPSPSAAADASVNLSLESFQFATTSTHLKAYLARFPQTGPSAIDPERKLILEKLQTVGTIHPDAAETTPNSGATEEKPVDPSEEELPDSIGPATHYVSRFATHATGANKGKPKIIDGGPFNGTQAGARMWNGTGTPRTELGYLPFKTQVLVEDEFLGPKRDMSRIKVVDMSTGELTDAWVDDLPPDVVLALDTPEGPFYIKSAHLGPCKGVPKSLPIAEPVPVIQQKAHPRAHPWPADWTELKSLGYYCYYDPETDEYKVKIDSPKQRIPSSDGSESGAFKSLNDWTTWADKKRIAKRGLVLLLSYYKKKFLLDEEVDKIMNSAHPPYIPETNQHADGLYFNERTEEIDVCVCFAAKYFDAIPDRAWSKEDFGPDGLYSAERSIHFAYSTLACRVEQAVTKISHHAMTLEKNKAYEEHAKVMIDSMKRLQVFPSVMKEYLLLNEIELDKKEVTIEIGLGGAFTPTYILLNQNDEVAVPTMVGFDGFELLDVCHDAAALHFLYSMEKMILEGEQDPSIDSITFVQKYFYPAPQIYPSSAPDKPEDVPDAPTVSDKGSGKDPAVKSQDKMDKVHKGDPKRGKSAGALNKENTDLSDTRRKIKIFEHRGRAFDFTGDNVATDLVFLINNVRTVDDVYEHVLNKTNLEQLGQIAISAIMCSMSDDDRARLMLAKLIAGATAECILQIIEEIKAKYPADYDKATKELEKAKKQEQEKNGKPPGPVPLAPSLTDAHGHASPIKMAKAADAQGVVHKVSDCAETPTVENSGESISASLTEEQKEVVKERGTGEKPAEGVLPTAAQKNTTQKISEKDHKRILLQFANDTKGNYQIARPILQRLIMACVPNHAVQDALNSFFDKADVIADLIPPVPAPPTTSYTDDAKTSDPNRGISEKVNKGIQAALAGALLATVLLILTYLKQSIDESCEENFGGAEGAIDPDVAKEAFSDAGIPGELAPEFMECLSKQLTPMEMQDLLVGIVTDDVRAAIKYCAAKLSPSGDDEHISDYMNNLPRAFDKMSRMLPADTFEAAMDLEEEQPSAPASGLLCDGDDEIESATTDPLKRAQQDRKRAAAKRISDILDSADNLLPKMPPISSGCGEEGILPRETESSQAMLDDTVSAIFLGAKMAFHEDATGFADALVVKELSGAQEGDVDFVGPSDEPDGNWTHEDPSDGQMYTTKGAEKKNLKNQKVRPRVAPRLRQSFQKSVDPDNPSFVFVDDASDNATKLTATADVINNVKPVSIMSQTADEIAALKAAEHNLKMINGMISGMGIDPFGSPEKAGPVMVERQKKATDAVASAETALKNKQELLHSEPPSIEIQFANQTTLEYVVPWTSDENEISDNYKMLIAEETIPSNDEDEVVIDSKNTPPVLLEEVEKYNFETEEGTYQSELFANFLMKKLMEAGVDTTTDLITISSSPGYEELKNVYNKIFQDFVRKAARQVVNSPIFDLEYFEQLSFSSTAVENPNAIGCPPNDGEPVDLLALAKVQEEVKDDYARSCKPTEPEMPRGHAFKDSCRYGVVKTFIRLAALEPLMRSVFVFSEYSAAEIMQDNMILEYVLESMKNSINRLDLRLYESIKTDAREIISERVKAGEKLPNIHNINNMEFLVNFDGTEDQRSEAAIKYLALEQFDDLIEKFEDVVGSRTESIFKRFLNPPQNSAEGKDTTEIGLPVTMPLASDAGWIRTIDVAKAQTTSIKDTRFVSTYSPGENQSFSWSGDGHTSNSANSKATMASLHLAYPDLTLAAGTFFLEKYIRIEDLPESDIPDSPIKKLIRERVGGPDGPASEYLESPSKWASKLGDKALGQTSPHLSGVVNIDAWRDFVEDLKNNEDVDFDGVKISDFFKPWKYGMRLVYVPPMSENAFNTGEKMGKISSHSVGTAQSEGAWGSMGSDTFLVPAWSMKQGGIKAYEELMEAVGESEGALGEIEKAIAQHFGSADASIEKARQEKAFVLKEELALEQAFETYTEAPPAGAAGSPNTINKDVGQIYSTHSRSVYVMPLASVENEISIENITDFSLEDHLYSAVSFREQLIETETFQFLFKYVFPLPRMLTLLTIYNANAVALSIPETASAFNRTKGVLRNLYYSLSPDDTGAKWWQRESLADRELGGNAGLKEAQDGAVNPQGSGPDLIAMALRTIPLFIRGMAEYVDPHYKLVSKLTNAGVFPPGKTWYSVPILWPANFPFGWGPPITAWGLMAYGVPEPAGDKQAKYSSKAGSLVNDQALTDSVKCDD